MPESGGQGARGRRRAVAAAIANAQRLAGAPGSTPPQAPSSVSLLRTFSEATRDAKESPGLFNVWQRDDKVLIEIQPDQLERQYFFSTNLDQGLGESRFLAGSMTSSLSRKFGGPAIVVFRKVGNNVQLVARNVKYTAQAGTPEARAVEDAFSDSLLATAPVVAQPHPERKSILVEANSLFFADITRRRVAARAGLPPVVRIRRGAGQVGEEQRVRLDQDRLALRVRLRHDRRGGQQAVGERVLDRARFGRARPAPCTSRCARRAAR